nr:cell division protein SepF [Motilibacter aurantiacus]
MAVYLGLVEDEADRYDRYDDYDGDERGYDSGYGPGHGADYDDELEPKRAEAYEPAPRPRRTLHAEAARPDAGVSELSGREHRLREPVGRGGLAHATEGSLATVPRPVAQAPAPQPTALDRITTIHPRSYNDAKQIGESFRGGTPVIMNLTDMDDADAKRLVDFAAGLIFGLRGTIERVTNKVFLLSPANVSVSAEDRARMAENGFFNQS